MSVVAKRSSISATAAPLYNQLPKHFSVLSFLLIMATLWNRAGHYIFAWCGPGANLECRSEVCCTRLTRNAGPKKLPKIRHLGTIAELCRAVSSQLRHVLTIRKKLLNSNISSTCPHNMVNFDSLAAEICWRVSGTPANFNGFPVLSSLLQQRHLPEVNQTLRDVWPSPVLVYYI